MARIRKSYGLTYSVAATSNPTATQTVTFPKAVRTLKFSAMTDTGAGAAVVSQSVRVVATVDGSAPTSGSVGSPTANGLEFCLGDASGLVEFEFLTPFTVLKFVAYNQCTAKAVLLSITGTDET